MTRYKFISHTADLKIRVYGQNLIDLINNILVALADYWQPSLKDKKIKAKIKVKSNDQINLLIDFIAQIIAKTYIKKAIFNKFEKKEVASNLIEGELIGYQFSSLTKDIKAVTYHQANLKKSKNKLILDFIVDI